MPLLARPVNTAGPSYRVSNAAAARPCRGPIPCSHSRSPGASATGSRVSPLPGFLTASTAIRREEVLDMPCMWVGPPTTSRSVSRTSSAVARFTGTTVTSHALSRRPSAMLFAMIWVFP